MAPTIVLIRSSRGPTIVAYNDVTIYVGLITDDPNDHKLIQNDLNNLIHWADSRQLK